MALLKREAIPRLVIPEEAVTVDAFGGDVVVRGLPLWQYIAIQQDNQDAPGKRASAVLAAAVVDADGLPVYTPTEWDAFGIRHRAEYVTLLSTAQRLSGTDRVESEKN